MKSQRGLCILVLHFVGFIVIYCHHWIADSEEATTKPTIDQEFEQYFSELMM